MIIMTPNNVTTRMAKNKANACAVVVVVQQEKERWATDIANFDDDRAVGTILEFKRECVYI
jgi:hypothetical protein